MEKKKEKREGKNRGKETDQISAPNQPLHTFRTPTPLFLLGAVLYRAAGLPAAYFILRSILDY
jgi:hypothetical protein